MVATLECKLAEKKIGEFAAIAERVPAAKRPRGGATSGSGFDFSAERPRDTNGWASSQRKCPGCHDFSA